MQRADTMPITTQRLVLRPMTAEDAPAFHALVTRPEVSRMLFLFPTNWPLSEAVPFLEAWRWQGRLLFRVAITLKGEWVGWIGADDAAEPEVFYAIRPEFTAQGIAQEALRGFTQFLFARFAPPALQAGAFTDNPASIKVLQRCGFVRTGEAMGASAGRTGRAPEGRFRLVRPDMPDMET